MGTHTDFRGDTKYFANSQRLLTSFKKCSQVYMSCNWVKNDSLYPISGISLNVNVSPTVKFHILLGGNLVLEMSYLLLKLSFFLN